MKEKITPYLKTLLQHSSIAKQYVKEDSPNTDCQPNDPLMEDKHEVVKGLIHKYTNRGLIKVSYQCAAHCRFCTRIRQIGKIEGTLTERDIDNIVEYLKKHPEIEDVILSGGDPLYTPKITQYLLKKIKHISSIKVIRIGTRLPFQLPEALEKPLLKELLSTIDEMGKEKPFYILVHIEHLDELTKASRTAIQHLRRLKVTLLSQTVLLKDINDDYQTLYPLFKELYFMGIQPYYLYHCDNVKGLEHFQVDKAKERTIALRLRKSLSGIACPLLVEDLENDYGKMPF